MAQTSNISVLQPSESTTFVSFAPFPWHIDSLHDLFHGSSVHNEGLQVQWKQMVQTWGGSVIVGGIGRAYVFCKQNKILSITVPLAEPVSP